MTFSGEHEPIRSDKASWRRMKKRKAKMVKTTMGAEQRRADLLRRLLRDYKA